MTSRCGPARVAQLLAGFSVVLGVVGCGRDAAESSSTTERSGRTARTDRIDSPRHFTSGNLTIWWDRVPDPVRKRAPAPTTTSAPTRVADVTPNSTNDGHNIPTDG